MSDAESRDKNQREEFRAVIHDGVLYRLEEDDARGKDYYQRVGEVSVE